MFAFLCSEIERDLTEGFFRGLLQSQIPFSNKYGDHTPSTQISNLQALLNNPSNPKLDESF